MLVLVVQRDLQAKVGNEIVVSSQVLYLGAELAGWNLTNDEGKCTQEMHKSQLKCFKLKSENKY